MTTESTTPADSETGFRPVADIRAALMFLTRLPVGGEHRSLSRCAWAFPVAGLVIGLIAGLVWVAAFSAGLGPWPAAFLALITSAVLTGGLHEDGLADSADGLGAGGSVERMVTIMRDSRIGGYGALALILFTGLKASGLALLPSASAGFLTLIAVHGFARGVLPIVMHSLKRAMSSGVASSAGRPGLGIALAALVLGSLTLLPMQHPMVFLPALFVASLVAILLARYIVHRLGGYTGDTIGLIEQCVETAIILTVAATFQPPSWLNPLIEGI